MNPLYISQDVHVHPVHNRFYQHLIVRQNGVQVINANRARVVIYDTNDATNNVDNNVCFIDGFPLLL